jgi:hypothetical protein
MSLLQDISAPAIVPAVVSEESYDGNIGMMEMVKFYRTATPEQITQMKALIAERKYDGAWELLKTATGVKLK